ncbi:hypothetical protein PLCT1_01906 [Planctomycetaceae bacterium]|nr:hypothetical protein PLCT1_01906 [Planctomycetaceae bacterium]
MERHYNEVMARLGSDMVRLSVESRELLGFFARHLFNKVPSVSALSGILVGAWVSSAFSTPPARSAMALLGILEAGRNASVASPLSYSLLSIFLPLFLGATTIYAVQKALKAYRSGKLARYAEAASLLGPEKLSELKASLAVLDAAREKKLLNSGEYETKLAVLYKGYTGRLPSGIEEFIVKKLTS